MVGRSRLLDSTALTCPVVPRWLKLGYGSFLAVLVPVYWREYGPGNFLWLSDIALVGTTLAVVMERPALAGMMAVGVLPLEFAWTLDFLLGGRALGLAGYMFDSGKSRFLRGLSLFHIVLPPTLLWMLDRFGYDRRSLARQTLLTWLILPLTYALTDPAANVNWVFGPGAKPQHRINPLLYLALEMAILPLLFMWPTHWLLRRFFSRQQRLQKRASRPRLRYGRAAAQHP
ncbi:MAG TPA: hypothetical protein VF502_12205 [Stellaceae bacterium]